MAEQSHISIKAMASFDEVLTDDYIAEVCRSTYFRWDTNATWAGAAFLGAVADPLKIKSDSNEGVDFSAYIKGDISGASIAPLGQHGFSTSTGAVDGNATMRCIPKGLLDKCPAAGNKKSTVTQIFKDTKIGDLLEDNANSARTVIALNQNISLRENALEIKRFLSRGLTGLGSSPLVAEEFPILYCTNTKWQGLMMPVKGGPLCQDMENIIKDIMELSSERYIITSLIETNSRPQSDARYSLSRRESVVSNVIEALYPATLTLMLTGGAELVDVGAPAYRLHDDGVLFKTSMLPRALFPDQTSRKGQHLRTTTRLYKGTSSNMHCTTTLVFGLIL
jgi:hypothetical protein